MRPSTSYRYLRVICVVLKRGILGYQESEKALKSKVAELEKV